MKLGQTYPVLAVMNNVEITDRADARAFQAAPRFIFSSDGLDRCPFVASPTAKRKSTSTSTASQIE